MSSRLITGEEAAAAQRVVWQPTGAALPPDFAASPPGVPPGAGPGSSPSEQLRTLFAQHTRIQELERELENRSRQAYQKGFSEGQAAASHEAAAKLEPALASAAAAIRELSVIRKRHLIEAEVDAVRLAVAVARKILHRELTVDPEVLLGVVKAAVERVDARETHRIRLHPEDLPVIQRHLSGAGMPPRVELVPDPSLERGGIAVETSRGCLDASVASQLKEIERGLVDLVHRSE